MLKWRGVIVLALVIAGLQGRSASAVSVYSDFGPGNAYDTFQGWIVAGSSSAAGVFEDAMSFTPSGDFTFDSADVAVGLISGTNSITVTLAANNSGAPGATLESLTESGKMGAFGSNNPPVEADSVTHPALHSGVEYWLVLSAGNDTEAGWNYNSTGVNGGDQSSGGGAFSFIADNPTGAFSINGAPLTPVPEPATIALFAAGVLAVAGARAARKRLAEERAA